MGLKKLREIERNVKS